MAADPAVLARTKRTGLGALNPAQGLDALAGIMTAAGQRSTPQIAPVPVDWSVILKKVSKKDLGLWAAFLFAVS